MPSELIELEITEDIILEDTRRTNLTLSELRSRAIGVAFEMQFLADTAARVRYARAGS